MTVVQAEEERNYQILVYGIEKKGLSPPKQPIRTRIFTLHFDSNSRRKEKSQFTPWQKGEGDLHGQGSGQAVSLGRSGKSNLAENPCQ